ncbi:hypothetical protein [Methanocorpusculum bavaricum]|uniref:hypothetical protein n=1 Tax=Methanocorpusculum bavaricum TaxID=71518 RepID=UPI0005B29E23|nr:hypothetical protein [Methanocorpusculum bavaricum]
MRPTLSDIQRRIEAITASSQTPVIIFVRPVYEGEEVTDRIVYDTIEGALHAFEKAHRITLDDKSIVFIDDVPDGIEEYNRDNTPHEDIDYTGPDTPEDEESAGSGIVGYILEN